MRVLFFLIDSLASFFAVLFLLRFLMQACRVSFSGPFGHFVLTLSNWAVKPLRKLIPGFAGYDWASALAAYLMQLLPALLMFMLLSPVMAEGDPLPVLGAILWAGFIGLLRLTVYVFIGTLIVQAVLSWVNPYSPLAGPADQLTRPLLSPIRSVVPVFSGIDLSPLIAILVLQVVLMFL